jgi:hypothetical protein
MVSMNNVFRVNPGGTYSNQLYLNDNFNLSSTIN